MSWQLDALNLWLRVTLRPYLARARSIAKARARMERQMVLFSLVQGTTVREAPLGARARRTLWLDMRPDAPILLWFHGGAFCVGSPRTHAAMVCALAARARIAGVLPDYRLAPEHPFPAALDDAMAAYLALLERGVAPARIAIGGDSAGGGLCLSLIHLLLAEGQAVPACAVVFSPWVDMTLSGASLTTMALRDAYLPAERAAEVRDGYLAGADPRDPRASPLFGGFRGGPPVLIQASGVEILTSDAERMAAHLEAEGVAVTLDLRPNPPHVWQMFHDYLPEADRALDRAADFLRAHLPDTGAPALTAQPGTLRPRR